VDAKAGADGHLIGANVSTSAANWRGRRGQVTTVRDHNAATQGEIGKCRSVKFGYYLAAKYMVSKS